MFCLKVVQSNSAKWDHQIHCLPVDDWCISTGNITVCKEIFQSNANTDGEQYIGHVTSPEECIQLVQANCEWANIANVHENVLEDQSADCWCQKGDNLTPDDTSEYLNCWFGESNDIPSDSGAQSEGLLDFKNMEGFGAMIGSASDNVVVTVTASDLVILGLLLMNVLTLTILICRCKRNGKKMKYNYEAVALSENESLRN